MLEILLADARVKHPEVHVGDLIRDEHRNLYRVVSRYTRVEPPAWEDVGDIGISSPSRYGQCYRPE